MASRKKQERQPEPADLEVKIGYETEIVPIAELKPHPRNYRNHGDDQLNHIVESIQEHGVYRNVVIARDGTILAGHGVVLAARKTGMTAVPVIRLDVASDDPRALKVLTGDNEISRLAYIDDRVLTEILKEIKDQDVIGLLGTGYDEQMLAALAFVTRDQKEIADFDAAAEWVGMPEYDVGPKRLTLVVSFGSQEDRLDLLSKLGLDISDVRVMKGSNMYSLRWPPVEIVDLQSVRLEEAEEVPT